jgi:phthalate 4,5-dioxygenase oxygenase subunit
MLSKEDNLLLTQVSRGTSMGTLLREYWLPMLFSNELVADGRTLKVKLLGEELVAFRDTSGRVGLIEQNCPHRGSTMYFARNENNGIRCVYHGWMYDVTGQCIEMPNEPESSNFKEKISLLAYKTQERNGLIWAYLGPREVPPPLPELEFNVLPPEHTLIWKNLQMTNWVQGLEGNIDSSHLSFLHTRLERDGSAEFGGGGARGLWYEDPAPRMEVMDTDYGVMYGAGRLEEPGRRFWRVTQFMMPIYGLFAPISPNECPMQWWIPLDDHTVMKWDVRWNPTRPITEEEAARMMNPDPGGFIEPTSDPYTHYRLAANMDNDYFIDWNAQGDKRYSGVPSVNLQDAAVQEGMGKIVKRDREHLGTADVMIIRTRRRLLNAARALRDHGTVPPGVDDPEVYHVRSTTVVLDESEGQNWQDIAGPLVKAFTDEKVMAADITMRTPRA